ncbi:hypothetical protein SGLAD_v1c01690 [Spiroplasma gladiatoris]|uniref:Uncharacterized protein n=1 Tax=Spiroplasma gladiatoris TaxID=2143 RepID=A0A4P7AI36_9MOLU|nr:hypothetical protein [Spiroplasma gladiatoris]QBQ07368.1 hypothetical protein SGLAD_v1c01690 [Spiroplasma gladiatoris]
MFGNNGDNTIKDLTYVKDCSNSDLVKILEDDIIVDKVLSKDFSKDQFNNSVISLNVPGTMYESMEQYDRIKVLFKETQNYNFSHDFSDKTFINLNIITIKGSVGNKVFDLYFVNCYVDIKNKKYKLGADYKVEVRVE